MMNRYILTLALLAASISGIAQNKEDESNTLEIQYIEDSITNIKLKDCCIDDIQEAKINIEYEEDEPFTSVEQMPSFPGGTEASVKFISDNLIYPESAQQAGLQGRVAVRFIVEADGSLSDIQILRGIDKECDKEAVRIIESMPKWIPGKQNGKEVRVYYIIPVTFRLNK